MSGLHSDVERIKWYILGSLNREQERKYSLIDEIENNRTDDWETIKQAFEELEKDGDIEQGAGPYAPYSLTESGEIKLTFFGSSVISVVDFVGVHNKGRLDQYLLSKLDKDEAPEERTKSGVNFSGGIGTLSISNEDWGSIETDRSEFDKLSVDVLFYNEVPLGYYVILSGRVDSEYYQRILRGDNASVQSARSSLLETWEELFEEFEMGLLSNLENPIEVVGQQTPITISTVKVDIGLNEAITGERRIPSGRDLQRSYTSYLGRNSLFEMFDVEPLTKKSLIQEAGNALAILGKSKGMHPDNKTYHSKYTIIEISDNLGHSLNMVPPSALGICNDYVERILPLLYIYNWYKYVNNNFWDMNEAIRKLEPTQVDTSGGIDQTQKEMERLLNDELEFTEAYSRIRFHNYISENYFDLLEDHWLGDSITEVPITDPRVTAHNKGDVDGVIKTLIDDSKEVKERTNENYDGLNDRYSTTSTSMNRLLSFQSASTNIQINKTVKDLTVVLVILALLSGFGFFTWYSDNVNSLVQPTFLLVILAMAWYIKRK
jgi:DNA-binding PadR family transcriptional regulator